MTTAQARAALPAMLPDRPSWLAPRHPSDAIRLVAGLLILALTARLVHHDRVAALEVDLFRLANDLPGWLYPPLWAVMQAGNILAVPIVAAAAGLARRFRLAVELAVAGGLAWLLAKLIKQVVDRGRPAAFLGGIHVHGPAAVGLGYLSGHAAVSVALVTTASPWLGRRARRAAWTAALLVCLSRMYVGAHLPLDVIGGAALGWAVGSLVHLLVGAPGGRPTPSRVRRALTRHGFEPIEVIPLGGWDARRSARFWASVADGATGHAELFVKLIPGERRDGDLLYRAWRWLLGAVRPGTRRPAPAPARPGPQVEHEAYLGLLAAQAGVRTPEVLLATPEQGGAGLLVQRWIAGRPLGDLPAVRIGDDLLRELWRQLACLQQARIAHRDLGAESVVADEQAQPWLVDFDLAEAAAPPARLAADTADLLLTLARLVGPERALATATTVLGREALADALSAPPAQSPARGRRAAAGYRQLRRDPLRDELRLRLRTGKG
jgi:membrane-associated phospholipid phosphatase